MDEQNLISNTSDNMNENMTEEGDEQIKEPWLIRNKTKILFSIIGILAICLLGTLDSAYKTEKRLQHQLKQRTESLTWLAWEHKRVRTERDFFAKVTEDVNYYKFIKTVYEGKDRDGFFETISIIYEESKRAGISPWETLSIVHQESGFNPSAVSMIWKRDKDGNMEQVPCAYGLMQINYNAWKDEKGLTPENRFDKRFNVRTGLEIYKYYLGLANGDKFLALFYYNNGPAPRNPNHSYAPAVMASRFMKMSVNYEPIELEKSIGISQ